MDAKVSCVARRNSSPNPGRFCSYQWKADSRSAAAFGLTTSGLTSPCPECEEELLPRGYPSDLHTPSRRAAHPEAPARNLSTGKSRDPCRDFPTTAPAGGAVHQRSAFRNLRRGVTYLENTPSRLKTRVVRINHCRAFRRILIPTPSPINGRRGSIPRGIVLPLARRVTSPPPPHPPS